MAREHEPSPFSELGGEPKLRAVIDDFIDRVFGDTMIGFFFAAADRARIKEKEYELAAAQLGADVSYTGRSLPEAHGRHPIMGGHFQRRVQILKETLRDHGVPESVQRRWLEHTEQMRSAITRQGPNECRHEEGARRLPLAHAAMAERPAPVPKTTRRELPIVGPRRGAQKP